MSSKNQVTLPKAAIEAAGIKQGDRVKVNVLGPGQVVLTRQDDLLAQYSGALRTQGALRGALEQLRDEWQ